MRTARPPPHTSGVLLDARTDSRRSVSAQRHFRRADTGITILEQRGCAACRTTADSTLFCSCRLGVLLLCTHNVMRESAFIHIVPFGDGWSLTPAPTVTSFYRV